MDKATRRHAACLLAAFIFLFCANTLFIHTHVAEGGVYVVHSHPFLPNSNHSHSNQQLQAISMANTAMLLLDTPPQAVVPPASITVFSLYITFRPHFPQVFHSQPSGRDPPSALLSVI